MDFEIQCDDFDTFEPTAEDFENETLVWTNEEEEDDLSDLLGYQSSFLGLVDTLNGYRV